MKLLDEDLLNCILVSLGKAIVLIASDRKKQAKNKDFFLVKAELSNDLSRESIQDDSDLRKKVRNSAVETQDTTVFKEKIHKLTLFEGGKRLLDS